MKLAHWLFSVCLLTASWDIIFVVHIGGNLRLTQLLMLPICVAALARMVQTGRILWPRGGTALSIWIFAQLLLLPLSLNLPLALEFFALLVFTVAAVFAVIQLYGESDRIESLMRVYMASFLVMAIIGIVQFVLPVIGLHSFFVSQWIIPGRLARINAFMYEPSYFATYIVIGWIMLIDLRSSRARITQGALWKWGAVVLTLALVLCTSKTGWLIMCIEVITRLLPILWRALRNSLREVHVGRLLLPLPSPRGVLATVLVFSGLAWGAVTLFSRINPLIFLAGSGLAGAPAHSIDARSLAFEHTVDAFLDHPWLGPSLGGVPVYIAAKQGVTITNIDGIRLYWGSPVILEVLASTGVFLFIPFLLFLYSGTIGAMRLARRRWPEERAKWLRALGRAMIFEWLMLFSEQNLLRVYLWYHFAMVLLVAYHLEFAPAPVPVDSYSRTSSPALLEADAAS